MQTHHFEAARAARPRPAQAAVFIMALLSSTWLAGCREEPSLMVGFARSEMAWRAGAKPGQVGTSGREDHEQELLALLQEIIPILQEDDYRHLLDEITEWSMETLEERTASIEPGRYSFFFEPGRGVELPPDVKAIVLRLGDEQVAIVRADIYLMHEQILRAVARLVEPDTGLGPDRIFLAGTHNHSAPHAISPAAGPWMMADAFDPRQFVYVTRAIAEAITKAHDGLRPAAMRVAASTFRDVQMNIVGQREAMLSPPDGGEPVPVRVGYPRDHFDDDLTIIRFEEPPEKNEEGSPDEGGHICSIFVLGMHPETLPGGHGITSGEWPLHVEERLTDRHGGFFMWLPGALGDIEPDSGRVNPEHDFWRGGFEAMDRMSEIIAGAVSEAWLRAGSAQAKTRPALAQVARDVPGPPDYPMPDSDYLAGLRMPFPRVLNDATTIRLHVVRLGDVLLAGIPAETVTDLSWNIKSRVGVGYEEVYQGYVYPDAPSWVRERIAGNFEGTRLPKDLRVKLPVVVNMTGGYVGYIVTRWEYENRDHYRQSLTTFGPGTAEHVAGAVVGLAHELGGGPSFEVERQPWHDADEAGVKLIASLLAELDQAVAEHYRGLPASDSDAVGIIVSPPSGESLEEDGFIDLCFTGGTNDLSVPRVAAEMRVGEGWEEVARGPGRDVWVLFEPPGTWTARWRPPAIGAQTTFRLRVEGEYRSAAPGSSEPDPLFDPEGANRPYTVLTEPFLLSPSE